ncbi:MAG TPA: fatty acid desaturase [Streptosporangiaceae bacterium]|nr:fatty acid desaturase [Streptosporangiaceae bacterium]
MTARNEVPLLTDATIDRLDATENTLLAPVRGEDRRRSLPKEHFQKRPSRFAVKLVSALGLIAVAWVAIARGPGWAAIAAIVPLGLAYAHLVELQHECLHEHAFRRRALNRFCGVICGMFMLSSFWHYKHDHLRHHAFLGTPRNREFFNYRFRDLHRWMGLGFLRAAFNLGRYGTVGADVWRSCLGRPIPGVPRPLDAAKIRGEYRLLGVVVLGAVAYTVLTGDLLLVYAWLLPAVLVGEPAHFMIELPEHFGLNTQTDANVLTNTRTITASRFAQWYTNYNNLHTAHHYHQGVPMAQITRLHTVIADQVVPMETSYWSFYRKVITGEIRYRNMAETPMTR